MTAHSTATTAIFLESTTTPPYALASPLKRSRVEFGHIQTYVDGSFWARSVQKGHENFLHARLLRFFRPVRTHAREIWPQNGPKNAPARAAPTNVKFKASRVHHEYW